MKTLSIILNSLLILMTILSVIEGEWEGQEIWLTLYLSAPAVSLYVILRSK